MKRSYPGDKPGLVSLLACVSAAYSEDQELSFMEAFCMICTITLVTKLMVNECSSLRSHVSKGVNDY